MLEENVAQDDVSELSSRIKDYIEEFERNGIDTLRIEE